MTALRESEDRIITVIQGECRVTSDPIERFSTVLGSCISCCLFDKDAAVGGMNHFILAQQSNGTTIDVKYGSFAMEVLINSVLKAGASRATLRAKLFGGANVTGTHRTIGETNGEFAKEFLAREGIPLVSNSIGGDKARRIHFWPTSGAARQFIVPRSDVVEDLEQAKLGAPRVQDVTLF